MFDWQLISQSLNERYFYLFAHCTRKRYLFRTIQVMDGSLIYGTISKQSLVDIQSGGWDVNILCQKKKIIKFVTRITQPSNNIKSVFKMISKNTVEHNT